MRSNQQSRIKHKGVIHLLLVLAVVFFLAHESQHDLPTVSGVDNTQCEFCISGHGPTGITTTEFTFALQTNDFFVNKRSTQQKPASFLGFYYSSRAPPAV
ncbi:MAG: hypothetical protein OEX19_09965 [Gammaproteobacteria bacterium]|nr:hypothetical protein [Gammaproteobacteria bacterium]